MLETYEAVCSKCKRTIFTLKNVCLAECCHAAEQHGLTVTRSKNGNLGYLCRKCKKEASNEKTL